MRSAPHEVLERLYRFVADGMVPSLARVIWRYHQNFAAQFDAARLGWSGAPTGEVSR